MEYKCRSCHGCQLVSQPEHPEPIESTKLPSEPWQALAADLLGPLPDGSYIFVVVDYYSRYFEIDILKTTTSEKLIESMERVFCTHGYPETLKTDNGEHFVSKEFEAYLSDHDIEHKRTTPLWPQANGEVERQNRTLLKVMQIAQAERKKLETKTSSILTSIRINSSQYNRSKSIRVDVWKKYSY
ncbi:uncharacterized protein K02A2.6-like [Gigantopelta aegis]|uniref:uncharacterized protein K02A2.6-like n=1 Tax=Gigantopelta aegis TaxID=1735272 RepID=UPI001B88AEC8|nr:uncharacterized protein K02A2.6-like [Gigantopelta aegis]